MDRLKVLECLPAPTHLLHSSSQHGHVHGHSHSHRRPHHARKPHHSSRRLYPSLSVLKKVDEYVRAGREDGDRGVRENNNRSATPVNFSDDIISASGDNNFYANATTIAAKNKSSKHAKNSNIESRATAAVAVATSSTRRSAPAALMSAGGDQWAVPKKPHRASDEKLLIEDDQKTGLFASGASYTGKTPSSLRHRSRSHRSTRRQSAATPSAEEEEAELSEEHIRQLIRQVNHFKRSFYAIKRDEDDFGARLNKLLDDNRTLRQYYMALKDEVLRNYKRQRVMATRMNTVRGLLDEYCLPLLNSASSRTSKNHRHVNDDFTDDSLTLRSRRARSQSRLHFNYGNSSKKSSRATDIVSGSYKAHADTAAAHDADVQRPVTRREGNIITFEQQATTPENNVVRNVGKDEPVYVNVEKHVVANDEQQQQEPAVNRVRRRAERIRQLLLSEQQQQQYFSSSPDNVVDAAAQQKSPSLNEWLIMANQQHGHNNDEQRRSMAVAERLKKRVAERNSSATAAAADTTAVEAADHHDATSRRPVERRCSADLGITKNDAEFRNVRHNYRELAHRLLRGAVSLEDLSTTTTTTDSPTSTESDQQHHHHQQHQEQNFVAANKVHASSHAHGETAISNQRQAADNIDATAQHMTFAKQKSKSHIKSSNIPTGDNAVADRLVRNMNLLMHRNQQIERIREICDEDTIPKLKSSAAMPTAAAVIVAPMPLHAQPTPPVPPRRNKKLAAQQTVINDNQQKQHHYYTPQNSPPDHNNVAAAGRDLADDNRKNHHETMQKLSSSVMMTPRRDHARAAETGATAENNNINAAGGRRHQRSTAITTTTTTQYFPSDQAAKAPAPPPRMFTSDVYKRYPLRTADGRLMHSIGLQVDITERGGAGGWGVDAVDHHRQAPSRPPPSAAVAAGGTFDNKNAAAAAAASSSNNSPAKISNTVSNSGSETVDQATQTDSSLTTPSAPSQPQTLSSSQETNNGDENHGHQNASNKGGENATSKNDGRRERADNFIYYNSHHQQSQQHHHDHVPAPPTAPTGTTDGSGSGSRNNNNNNVAGNDAVVAAVAVQQNNNPAASVYCLEQGGGGRNDSVKCMSPTSASAAYDILARAQHPQQTRSVFHYPHLSDALRPMPPVYPMPAPSHVKKSHVVVSRTLKMKHFKHADKYILRCPSEVQIIQTANYDVLSPVTTTNMMMPTPISTVATPTPLVAAVAQQRLRNSSASNIIITLPPAVESDAAAAAASGGAGRGDGGGGQRLVASVVSESGSIVKKKVPSGGGAANSSTRRTSIERQRTLSTMTVKASKGGGNATSAAETKVKQLAMRSARDKSDENKKERGDAAPVAATELVAPRTLMSPRPLTTTLAGSVVGGSVTTNLQDMSLATVQFIGDICPTKAGGYSVMFRSRTENHVRLV